MWVDSATCPGPNRQNPAKNSPRVPAPAIHTNSSPAPQSFFRLSSTAAALTAGPTSRDLPGNEGNESIAGRESPHAGVDDRTQLLVRLVNWRGFVALSKRDTL